MEAVNSLKEIIDKVIDEINNGKGKIFNILEGLKDEEERKKLELAIIRKKIEDIIFEVEELEHEDKVMRQKLSNSSKKFNSNEEETKEIYEKALEVRVKYITKENEERELRKKRDEIELSLKSSGKNINDADIMIKQINIALGYLQGDIISNIQGAEEEAKELMGIKILEMLENERRRIARDVHDGPAQYIANTLMRIDFCRMLILDDVDKGIEELDDLKKNVRSSLKEIREILFDLRPIAIEEKGMKKSMEDMVDHIIDNDNIEIISNIEVVDSKVDYMVKMGMYRVVQEIINNVKKHSKASKVTISIKDNEKNIELLIKDNGIGFDIKKEIEKVKKEENSYGLIGIYDRIKQLQGTIKIESIIQGGTTYKIRLPILKGESKW